MLHLTAFQTTMLYHGATNFALYRAFPTFLGMPLLWFTSLPPGSIHSFDNLSRVFQSWFTMSQVYHKTGAALHYVRKEQHEPLREYMSKFQAIATEIPNLDHRSSSFASNTG
ncbi:hypothetical protein Cni_G22021 [Canna indica]|uniref:Retrotransposon gag domain-containing protein n=1 Tax=Canna indica TaxID=4628 RepID=A0AAQ3KTM4_9LILI|nr:hypothetical protein Cni_G22021 [Canna indica]